MEFDLKAIGVTVFIGAYFLFGLEVLLYLFFSSNLFLTIEKETRFTSRSLIVLALTLSFAFGMLIEDISNKFVDKDEPLQTYILSLFSSHSSDDEIKLNTLFGKPGTAMTDFASEMSRLGLIKDFGGTYGADVQAVIIRDQSTQQIERAKLMAVAKQLYYHAKNRVYREVTYYDELKEIQLRIDFSRSYLAISFLLMPIALMLLIVSIIYWKQKAAPELSADTNVRRRRPSTLVLFAVLTFMYLGISCLVGTYAFVSEETEFDNRAYGYFCSMNATKEPQKF